VDVPCRPFAIDGARRYAPVALASAENVKDLSAASLGLLHEGPPRKGDRGEDFRGVPNRDLAHEPLLDALVRDVKARQAMVRSVLEDEEESQPLPFVGSMSVNSGVGTVLASIRQTLDLDLPTFRAQGTAESAFSLLREKVEAAGVFVLLMGNLGSHHTALDTSTFRGFAIADTVAPFIIVNDQDAKSAWSFTLLHELAHLWLGATGISGGCRTTQLNDSATTLRVAFYYPIRN